MCRNLMNALSETRDKSDREYMVRVLGMALAIKPDDMQFRVLRARTALSIDMLEVVLGDAANLQADADGENLLQQARRRDRQRNARNAIRMRRLDDVTRQVTGREPTSARLTSEPAFHVGMIVRHKQHKWYGVISEWALAHESHRSNHQKRLQLPCYTVAVDRFSWGDHRSHSSLAYVAEHELERRLPPTSAAEANRCKVHHANVGVWFTHYDEETDMYHPNDFVRYRFPDDRVCPLL